MRVQPRKSNFLSFSTSTVNFRAMYWVQSPYGILDLGYLNSFRVFLVWGIYLTHIGTCRPGEAGDRGLPWCLLGFAYDSVGLATEAFKSHHVLCLRTGFKARISSRHALSTTGQMWGKVRLKIAGYIAKLLMKYPTMEFTDGKSQCCRHIWWSSSDVWILLKMVWICVNLPATGSYQVNVEWLTI
jgi:hypothetical protein